MGWARGGPPSHPPGWGPPGRGGYPGGPRPRGGRTPGRGRAIPGRSSVQQVGPCRFMPLILQTADTLSPSFLLTGVLWDSVPLFIIMPGVIECLFSWRQGRGGGQANPQKQSQQSAGQGKTKKQKLVELDDKPAKPWKPLNAAEIAEGQRYVAPSSNDCMSHILTKVTSSALRPLAQRVCVNSASNLRDSGGSQMDADSPSNEAGGRRSDGSGTRLTPMWQSVRQRPVRGASGANWIPRVRRGARACMRSSRGSSSWAC